jgi:1-acyl-sn-glycerol-3-phosphate acyltransferase
MLPPRPMRRLALVPLVIVITAGLAISTPLVALLSAAFSLVRRPARPGRRAPRSRALRVAFLALTWSAGETAGLTALLCLWIASGLGGRLRTEPYQARHYGLMRWFLDLVYRAAQRACGLRVSVTGPGDAADAGSRPLIVACRHAGPGDSLLLVHHLLTVCGRRPRVVMKAALQLDPIVDIAANRVPNAFLRQATRTGRGDATAQIRRLAAGLDGRDALVIFPEGGNWTPLRWQRAIERLRRRGQGDLAARMEAMPNVLPPRPAGTLAALAACPEADVIFVAHTGLDRLVSVRDVWRSLLTDMEVRARCWRVPSAAVPRAAGHDAQVAWLYDWWGRVDAWITAERARMADGLKPMTATGT